MLRGLAARSAIVVIVAVPAGTAGATGESTEPDESPPPTSVAEPAADSTGDEERGNGPPADLEFHIDMVLGLIPQQQMEEYWREQGEQQEAAIQECMNEAGLDYNPDTQGVIAEDPFAELSAIERAERVGFEIYTIMGPENDPYAGLDIEYTWPNQEIVEALSPEEQDAWFDVNNRCSMEVYGGVESDPLSNPMVQQALADFSMMIESDPRMAAANEAWSDCMEAAGHPYAEVGAMYEQWFGEAYGETGEGLVDRFWQSEAWEPNSPDHAEWQAMVDLEIEVAVANARCSEPLENVRLQVSEDLRGELIAMLDAVDWDLPPVTFPSEELFSEDDLFGTIPVDALDPEPDDPDGTDTSVPRGPP